MCRRGKTSGFLPSPVLVLAVAVTYVIAAKVSFLLTIPPGNISPVFPPAGLALAAAIVWGRKALVGVWLGSFVANSISFVDGTVSHGPARPLDLLLGAVIGLGAACGAAVGSRLVRRFCRGEHPLHSGQNVLVLALVGALGGCLISPTVGVACLTLDGKVPWEHFVYSWLTWWVGDASGALVAAPLVLAWEQRQRFRRPSRSTLEAVVLVAATIVVCYFVFFRHTPFQYVLLPLVLWAAFRFGMLGAATSAASITLFAVIGTSLGSSPFARATVNESLLMLNSFLAVTTTCSLFLAGLLEEQRRFESALRESEERARLLGDNLPDSYVYQYTFKSDGTPQFLHLSAGVERLHGVKAKDVLHDASVLLQQIAPEMIPGFQAAEATSLKTLTDFTMEIRMRRADGLWRWMRVCSRPRRTSGGQVLWDGVATDISVRKEAEAASRAAARRLHDIIEFLPDPTFVIDESKRVIAWNRACETLTAVKKEALLGQGDYAYAEPFYGERRPILIDLVGMSSSEVEAPYEHLQRKGDLIYGETFIARLNQGRGAHLWGVAAPLLDGDGRRCGAIEVVRDVTEQKRVEQALRESELKHRTLFETANDATLLMRADRFVDCNARTLTVFGCSREQMLGAPPGRFSPPTQPDGRRSDEKAREKIRLAIAGEPQFFGWEHCRADGTPFSAEVSLNCLELGSEKLVQAIVRDVTRRKRAEAAIRQSEERFRLIMESLTDLVAVLDLEGRRLYNSPSYRNLLGAPDQLHGSSSFEQIHPEDRERVRDSFKRTVQTEIGERLEYRLVDTFGQVHDIESQGSVIRDEQGRVDRVLVVSRDVTERHQAEAARIESEQKYRELVEHANSIILRWNAEGHITFLNEFGLRFFGYSAEEIFGRHVMGTIVPPAEIGGRDLRRLMEEICANPAAFEQNTNENMRRDGERVWIAWTNKVVRDPGGQAIEILSVGTDVTAQRHADEQVRRLHEELQRHAAQLEKRVAERTRELAQAKARAEAADRVKSAFLATMSHELRTPLNSIIGFTGVLLQGLAGPLNPEQSKQLDMVRSSARHLLALINDVLDISKIEAGQLQVVREPFDLHASIVKMVNLVQPLAEKKALSLQVRITPGLGQIVSDSRRVEQILLNLLNNAIKFTETGEVTLHATETDRAVRIVISDTGIGIKPADLTTLFQPFRQIDTGLTRNHEGTGLGLAICRRLADLLGGEISAESIWRQGSAFSLVLPKQ